MRNAIIIIIVLTLLYHCSIKNYNKKQNYVELFEFKTGQVLFGRYDYWNTGSYFPFLTLGLVPFAIQFGIETHVGLVVVIDDKPYVYQMGNSVAYNHKTGEYERFRDYLVDAQDYYNRYEGNVYIWENPDITTEFQDKIVQDVMNEPRRDFTHNPIQFANTVLSSAKIRGDEYICTRLVQELLPIKWSQPAGLETINEMKYDLKKAGWTKHVQLQNVFTDETS